jgi:enoyl-CoA hydratase/carnithine racemase
MSTPEGQVLFSVDGGVATLTLNRPEKLNAVTVDMGHRVHTLIKSVNDDQKIRVLVVTGNGERAFCVGTDLAGFDQYGTNWQTRNRESDYALDFFHCRKPVIAAIRGYCVGGGLEVALMSDIRLATNNAEFGCAEIKHGWLGGSGSSQFLPRLIGYGKALEMLMTGDRIDAQEAYRVGLVQRLVADDELLSEARNLAETIASNPPIAVQLVKHSVRMGMSTALAVGMAYENDLFSYCMTTADATEGRRAFVEKRTAEFHGE